MSHDLDLVAALAKSVLPDRLAVAARDPRLMPDTTDPHEGAAVSGAVPRRIAEFHAGRAAARAAMVALSLPPRPIPMGPDRAPIWPSGICGSISHSSEACVAAVGLGDDWVGIGIDIEEATALDPLLVAEVCTLSEQAWLGRQPPDERGLMAKLMFSIKESAYKAQYPLSGALFGFEGFEVEIDRAESRFFACFSQSQGPFGAGTIFTGEYVHAAGLLVTGVAVGHSVVKV